MKPDRKAVFLALLAAVGFSAGLLASQMYGQASYCQNLEDQIKQQQDFNGSLTCYPPGTVDVNLSEKVGNKTDLECVCRKVQDGNSILLPITKTR